MRRWTKCSERMPNDGEHVLVKTKSGVVRGAIYVDDGIKGWLIDVTASAFSRKEPGDPMFWKPIK